jgi:hypothetical protein
LLIVGAVAVANAATLSITLLNSETQQPVEGATVVVYLSYGVLAGFSDAEGTLIFDGVEGRGFWLEINGERLSDFFYTENSPLQIQLDSQGGAQ